MNALKDILHHHFPLALGAMAAVILMAAIEHAALSSPKEEIRNLYVVHTPCMTPATAVRVYNDYGQFMLTNQDGVLVNPPKSWTVIGAQIRVMIEDHFHMLTVEKERILRIHDRENDKHC